MKLDGHIEHNLSEARRRALLQRITEADIQSFSLKTSSELFSRESEKPVVKKKRQYILHL
jgi:hypothetical protein